MPFAKMSGLIRSRLPSSAVRISACSTRQIHASLVASRRAPVKKTDDPFDIDQIPDYQYDDTTSLGHRILRERRKYLTYLRLIEDEVPKLEQFRKPFVPPTSKTPVLIRTISYGGEPHPADRKAAIVVPVSKLPLKDAPAVHKFKLLAGVRWTIDPPKDSGISETEKDLLSEGSGYFKISCEDFPEAQQNVKWCSDTLDKILKEANNGNDTFADVPQDFRHLHARAKKQGLSEDARGRAKRASIADFPKEWLPQAQSMAQSPL